MRKIEWRFRFVSIGEERALRDFWFFSFLFFFPIIRAPRKQKKKTKASKKAEREREGALQKRKKRKSHTRLFSSLFSLHTSLLNTHTQRTQIKEWQVRVFYCFYQGASGARAFLLSFLSEKLCASRALSRVPREERISFFCVCVGGSFISFFFTYQSACARFVCAS